MTAIQRLMHNKNMFTRKSQSFKIDVTRPLWSKYDGETKITSKLFRDNVYSCSTRAEKERNMIFFIKFLSVVNRHGYLKER